MHARLNRKMREAAKITIVPLTDFVVNSAGKCDAMNVMATALPNLQKITLGDLRDEHKYIEGEDPDDGLAARTANATAHDIGIIANFTNLRELSIGVFVQLNGRYPCFFNFPHLQTLSISALSFSANAYLKFDLGMLSGLPSLKMFHCEFQDRLTGDLNSLIALKDTLEKVTIVRCRSPLVMGNFMDLADFPHLKELDLSGTAVRGDIRDIGEKDFPSLTVLALPKGVNGGIGHVFQRISDAQNVARIPYLFQKQRPEITLRKWYALLAVDSIDRYESLDEFDEEYAPVFIRLVRAGTRVGYRWESGEEYLPHPCEVNWLDPEPDRESASYGKYMEELQKIEGQVYSGTQPYYFKGFHQPPTQEEFERILERIHNEALW
jgi:hypothetical protein